jgi:hypothetical protein
LQRGARQHCTSFEEWDEFVHDWQRIYDSMQKPAFVFDGRNILNGLPGKNRICVSKYRFLGSQPSPLQREGAEAKKSSFSHQKITDYTISL